jgi:hypothetical protein
VSSKALLDSCRNLKKLFRQNLILVAVCLLALTNITGCGSEVTSTDIPKDFIREFIAKHETMVDKSLVYYYVKCDQPEIAEKIAQACRLNRSKGKLTSLAKATFDFSDLQIELVDQKEEYVNDEPVLFVKVALKGFYRMKLPEATQEIAANDIIVLEMVHNEWKVTSSRNPWSHKAG